MALRRFSYFLSGLLTGSTITYAVFLSNNDTGGKHDKAIMGNAVVIPPTFNADHVCLKYGTHGPQSDLLIRKEFVVSYNRRMKQANYVAEYLTKDILDGKDRDKKRSSYRFKEDRDIPQMFRSKLRSGYDRGHLAPASDCKTNESLAESFLLTNVSPQSAPFNRNIWLSFENFVRSLTLNYDEVYVVTGPMWLPKSVDNKSFVLYEVLGDPPNIPVPTHFFKVIMGTKKGRFYTSGFLLPNESIEGKKVRLSDFIVPVKSIEHSTGLVFFPLLVQQENRKMIKYLDNFQSK